MNTSRSSKVAIPSTVLEDIKRGLATLELEGRKDMADALVQATGYRTLDKVPVLGHRGLLVSINNVLRLRDRHVEIQLKKSQWRLICDFFQEIEDTNNESLDIAIGQIEDQLEDSE